MSAIAVRQGVCAGLRPGTQPGCETYSSGMADDDLTGWIWEPMLVGRPAGTHYSHYATPSDLSPLARDDDTNRLERQVRLRDPAPEEDEQDPSSARNLAIGAALGIAGTLVAVLVAVKVAPHVKSRLGILKARWATRYGKGEVEGQAVTAETAALSSAVAADFSREVDVALEEHRSSMSSAEAQRRLLAVLMAAAFIAEQMRALAHARIEDEDAFPELASAMQKLTAPQITDSIDRALETAGSSLLDPETSAEFLTIFGGGRVVNGEYVPLRNVRIKEALRLIG